MLIDPAIIYWMNTAEKIFTISCVLGVVCLFSTIGFMIGVFYNKGCEHCEENAFYLKVCEKALKWLIPMCMLFLICITFIPSKDTLTEMLICRIITRENVSMAVEDVKSAVDYIISAIKSL